MLRRSLAALVTTVAVTACGGAAPAPRRDAAPAPAPPAPRVAARPGDLVIADVTVVPMARPDGAALPRRTVIVRGERIVAVELADRVDVPAGATRVDGAGRWLLPGLADMHVHLWSKHDLTLLVAAGVTTARHMFGSPRELAWRGEIARGERLGPTLVVASPVIDGSPPVWLTSTVLTDPAAADRLVGELKAQGYDLLKPYSRLSAEVYDALVAAARKHGMELGGHVPRAIGLHRVLAAGQRTIEHLDGWLDALEITAAPGAAAGPGAPEGRRYDESRIPALVQETIAAGTWSCPTLIVWDRLAALDDLEAVKRRARWLRLASPRQVTAWQLGGYFSPFSRRPDFAQQRRDLALRGQIAAALARAGARLLVGTDANNPFVIPGESLHDELELLVAAGIPRARALHAATAGAAEYLGQAGQAGVVAPGARADLLLSDADPLAGPLPLVPAGVVVRGRWLPRAELEQRLAEVERANAGDPPAPSPAAPAAGGDGSAMPRPPAP